MKYFVSCIVIALSISCSGQKIKTLDPKSFKSEMEATPGAVLIDVRTPEETAQGIIAGAIQIDFKAGDFEKRISALEKDKTYFVYCSAGVRSGKAAGMLKEKGFKNVYSLEGGTTAWTDAGLTLTKPVKK